MQPAVRLALVVAALAAAPAACGRSAPRGDELRKDARVRAPSDRAPSSTTAGGAAAPCPPDMVHVPGGTFSMGASAETRDAPASPMSRPPISREPGQERVRLVTLSPYCIDRTEVTVAAYAACASCAPAAVISMAAGPDAAALARACNGTRPDRVDHPVNCVTWAQADGYCRTVGKALPTEAQWEYAARGSDGRTYPWGDEPPSTARLNACDDDCRPLAAMLDGERVVMFDTSDGHAATAPVGSFPAGASPFGALDLAGNVEEWVAEWFYSYQAGAYVDPVGAPPPAEQADARTKLIRGGGWRSPLPLMVSTPDRWGVTPTVTLADLGFRCARSL